jgi:hypothetical protein
MIGSAYSRLSKEIGWEGEVITAYPTKRSLRKASDREIFKLHRFLRSPVNEEEVEIMGCLEDRFHKMQVELQKQPDIVAL